MGSANCAAAKLLLRATLVRYLQGYQSCNPLAS